MSLDSTAADRMVCGLVMPISETDGCAEGHWKDVLSILSDAIASAGLEPNLVSNDTDIGVIHKRIVHNLYFNPIVVCDVSGRNPNVMFELGMRLAFDKPVVIVKDDRTPYSFDTSPVEHLTYPRDLRFGAIVEFKLKLVEKIRSSTEGRNSFLSSFGTFKVAKIEEENAGALEIVMEELGSLKGAIARLDSRNRRPLGVWGMASEGFGTGEEEKEDILRDLRFLAHGLEEARNRFSGALKAGKSTVSVRRQPLSSSEEEFSVLVPRNTTLPRYIEAIRDIAKKHTVELSQITIGRAGETG